MEPKIRLKGFSGEWETTTLGDIASFSKGHNYSKSDIRNSGTPIILYGRLYTKYSPIIENVDTFVIPKDGSVFSKGGEVIIPASGETPEDISIASCVKGEGVILGGDLNVLTFDSSKYDPSFMAMAISSGKTHKELSSYAQGKTIVHLHNDDIAKGHISFPCLKEQLSIVDYTTSLDSQIKASTSSLASLKQIKAASLQAMFPQEGETVPKVRFKGFTGEWRKKKFSELYERSMIKNDLSFGKDKIISVANMYFIKSERNVDEEYLKSYNIMRVGDVAFEGNKSKHYAHGRLVENTIGDGIVSHVFVVMKPISKQYDLDFWKYYINNEDIMGKKLVRCTKSSTMMTDIVIDDFLKESILVPSYEEQVEIGKILSSLDNQITLQSQRLEKLKQIKAACLDKMFV